MNITKRTKWLILAAFSLIVGVNQLLWLTFATIVISTQEYFGVSEFKANLLTLIFPAVYVLLSLHSGSLLDRKGYKKVVSFAAILMLAGSVIRLFGVQNYWVVLVGQLLIAISQPYMTNAINQITADWFPPEKINTATGLMVGGLFFGMAIGAFISPILIESVGFHGMLLANVAITAVVVTFFLVVIQEKRANTNIEPEKDDVLTITGIGDLLRSKQLWLISLLVFIAMGYFNGLTNWIAPILEPRGINEEQSGLITAMLIFGGIFGAIIIPMLSDKLKKRQLFVLLAVITGTFLTFPLLTSFAVNATLIVSFVLGFILLAGYPLLIASAESIVPQAHAAKAVSLMQLMGNMGGVIIVLLMETVKNITGSWVDTVYVLVIVMAVAIPLAWKLRDV